MGYRPERQWNPASNGVGELSEISWCAWSINERRSNDHHFHPRFGCKRAQALLDEAGDPRWNPDSYRPRDPDEELKLAKRLEGIARERDLDSLEQLDRLTATIRATIGPRGGMRP